MLVGTCSVRTTHESPRKPAACSSKSGQRSREGESIPRWRERGGAFHASQPPPTTSPTSLPPFVHSTPFSYSSIKCSTLVVRFFLCSYILVVRVDPRLTLRCKVLHLQRREVLPSATLSRVVICPHHSNQAFSSSIVSPNSNDFLD